jgi:hypothetical protein
MCLPVSFTVKALWGQNPSLVYAVGYGGHIMRYDGTRWMALSSGTTLDIRDIWGGVNPRTGWLEILAVASGYSPTEGKKLLFIEGSTVTAIPDSGLSWSLYGLWFVPGQHYYVVGAGIGQKNELFSSWWPLLDTHAWSVYPSGEVTSYLSAGVRGTGANDVFVVGSFMECVHFNGSTWHNYRDQIASANGSFSRIAIKGNLAIAVGAIDQQGVAVIGRRTTK